MSESANGNENGNGIQPFTKPRVGAAIVLVFTVAISLVSVGLAAALSAALGGDKAQHLGQVGQIYESVAAVFSGLAFIALVITFKLQLDELQLQRYELTNQRHAMTKSQSALNRSAEVDVRRLHVELIKMSIDDEMLGMVWPQLMPVDPDVLRQYRYANLIIQHHWLMSRIDAYSDEQIRQALRYLFLSPVMRSYWRDTTANRSAILPVDSEEWKFTQIIDEIYNEYVEAPEGSPDAA